MPIDPEVAFVHKILTTGDLKKAIDLGIRPDPFINTEAKTWFEWLLNYYRDLDHPGAVPELETFKYHFPKAGFSQRPPNAEIGELVQMMRLKQLKSHLGRLGNTLTECGRQMDVAQMLSGAQGAHRELMELLYGLRGQRPCWLSSDVEAIFEEYEFRKQGILQGALWPWQVINQKTGGIENGDMITFYGRPKQLKSWLAMVVVVNYYLFSYTGRVLIYSCEMKKELFRRRAAAVIASIHYGRYRAGQLEKEEEERFYSALRGLHQSELNSCTNGHKKELIIVRPGAEMGVQDLQSKIETMNPDLVLVDGAQHMAAGLGGEKVEHKAQTNLSWSLKHRVADQYNIPLIAVHQANRKSGEEDLDDIAFSDSWARDSDALIKVQKIRTDENGQICALFFSGAREYDMTGIMVHAKPAYNFGYIEEIESPESFREFLKNNKEKNIQSEETKRRTEGARDRIRSGNRIVV